jgi:hypothetical protein
MPIIPAGHYDAFPVPYIPPAVPFNLLSPATCSLEDGSLGGWTAVANATAANSTVQALDGTHSLVLTCTTAGAVSMYAIQALPTVPGFLCNAVSYILSGNAPRQAQINVSWLNISSGLIFNIGSSVTLFSATDRWTALVASGISPPTTAYVSVYVIIAGSQIGDVHYIDHTTLSLA